MKWGKGSETVKGRARRDTSEVNSTVEINESIPGLQPVSSSNLSYFGLCDLLESRRRDLLASLLFIDFTHDFFMNLV